MTGDDVGIAVGSAIGSAVVNAVGEVTRVRAEDTLQLRRDVLREGRPTTFPSDADPAAVHLALRDGGGTVVACGLVRPSAAPAGLPADDHPWQLGGMAAAPELRGQGQGSRVLLALLEAARSGGATGVWCNARTPARSFYRRAGLQEWGEQWDAVATDGLAIGPHVVMWLRV